MCVFKSALCSRYYLEIHQTVTIQENMNWSVNGVRVRLLEKKMLNHFSFFAVAGPPGVRQVAVFFYMSDYYAHFGCLLKTHLFDAG